MIYFISIPVALVIFFSFFALTWYETKRGARLFEALRARFDQHVGRIEFILTHIDLGAFLREAVRHFARRVAHDSAHFSLQVVRAVERLLTRLVRRFRMRQTIDIAPRGNARAFVKTLSDFKNSLKTIHPDVLDIR